MAKVNFNFEFSLEVFEGRKIKKIGSEIEPVKVSEQQFSCCDIPGCNNIITTEWYLIIQGGKPYIIKSTTPSITGEWTEHFFAWEAFACNHLPAGTGIYRK